MIKAVDLRCEYLKNPKGIDCVEPRLMWKVSEAKRQSAYQVEVFIKNELVWDSGKTESSRMQVSYPLPLESRQEIEWKVTLWDEADKKGLPAVGTFTVGLLKPEDWKAKWIAGDYTPKKKQRYPADCFKKIFNAENVVKARLYITACGLYEASLNGKRVGNVVLAPGITDYRKRIQYQTYDVTESIGKGENCLELMLADGWYRGSVGAWAHTCAYGTQTKVLAQLELTDKNGKLTYVCTDGSFSWSNDGAIRFADNKDGEIVDARLMPTYKGKAREVTHNVIPSCSNNVQVTEHERFTAEIIKTPKGATVLDFKQNIAGYIEFDVKAVKGQKIVLRFGEILDENGEFTQDNIQCKKKNLTTPLQRVEYICKDGENRYKTRFAIFGFRYVLVETDAEIKAENFTAVAVYSDMPETISFKCSNSLINKLVESTIWSAKSNSCDLPTDCPTRERHGWAGDAQLFVKTASYLFDYAPFIRKYLLDMQDLQTKQGRLPQIAPYGGVDHYMNTMNGSVGWADAGVLIPYRIWKHYGDVKILRDFYPMMKKYADFMIKRCGKFSIWAKHVSISKQNRKFFVNCGQSYGEWAEPSDVRPFMISDFMRPHPEESTAYTSYVMRHLKEIAQALGEAEDERKYKIYEEGCRNAYRELITKKGHTISDTQRQAKLVRPLYMELLDNKTEELAKERLISVLDNYGWRLGTGFLSTPFILYVLADMNIEYAYKLLENEECPGWLFMPKHGATTIWEAWEGNATPSRGIASLNHYSKGAVCEWLFSVMCGIKIDGKKKFVIAPKPGGTVTYAKTEYDSIYGKVVSAWERKGEHTVFTIEIPCNTIATLELPSGEKKTLDAGSYTFEE